MASKKSNLLVSCSSSTSINKRESRIHLKNIYGSDVDKNLAKLNELIDANKVNNLAPTKDASKTSEQVSTEDVKEKKSKKLFILYAVLLTLVIIIIVNFFTSDDSTTKNPENSFENIRSNISLITTTIISITNSTKVNLFSNFSNLTDFDFKIITNASIFNQTDLV